MENSLYTFFFTEASGKSKNGKFDLHIIAYSILPQASSEI